MLPVKRKRTPNFSEEEKLRFVRLLQEHGNAILTKVTSHNMETNKEKVVAWKCVTENLNAAGKVVRTEETLKKLWQKLKSEAKTYRTTARNQIIGTGGGPSKKFEDPVLELVAEINGRGTTGIEDVDDCDAGTMAHVTEINEMPYDHDCIKPDVQIIEIPFSNENINIENITIEQDKTLESSQETPQKTWAKRRQPVLTDSNERTAAIKSRSRLCNSFAAERLRAEREKTELIQLQKKHMLELHELDVQNRKLKQKLLESLINKLAGTVQGT